MRAEATSPNRPLQLICGDLRNLGDLMLLMQNLSPEVLAGPGDVRIRRWQALPEEIVRQVGSAGGRLVDGSALLSYAWQCRGSDMVIGGGQLVRDNISLRSLAGLALAVAMTNRSGGRVLTRGLGVSRIGSHMRRILWRIILRRCDTMNLRDNASMEHVRKLLPSVNANLTADMVLLPTSATSALRDGGTRRDAIVLAPCIDAGEGRLPGLEGIEQLFTAAHAILPKLTPVIACHDPRPGMDLAAAQAITDRCERLAPEIHASFDLPALTSLYCRAQLVLTNRLHAMIFGLLAGSSVVLIDDGNPKLNDIADSFAVPRVRHGDGQANMAAAIEVALAFDAERRAATMNELAKRASGNLR